MNNMNKKSRGATSSTFLILGVVLLVVIIIVFIVIKMNAAKTASKAKTDASQTTNEPPKPVYETQIGDVKFTFQDAQDVGQVLKSTNNNTFSHKDLTTTEKFIKVTIGAQNKGKVNVKQATWNLGNIVDSDGRNFVSVSQNQGYDPFNQTNLCGTLLKPDFEPTPCVKYYEVAKSSTDLKVVVYVGSATANKKQEAFINLIIK